MTGDSTSLRVQPRTTSSFLWKLLFAIAVLIGTAAIANAFLPADRAITRGMFGHDFLAFYSAGKLVHDDRAAELYDLDAMAAVERSVAAKAGLEMNAAVAPWWNPPHVALLFSPLSQFSFGSALLIWSFVGAFCLAISALLLSTLIRDESARRSHWLLVPAAILLAPPTLQAFGHGQNTAISLLLLTLTVLAWRAREPIWAGVLCALLCYKPQLAAFVLFALTLTLGPRVLIGTVVGGVPQLLLTVTRLPGSISDFFEQLPRNLEQIQFAQPYAWHRHSTLNGFFRFMLQGNGAGETFFWITALATTCAVIVGAAVTYVWWNRRSKLRDDVVLDRFIALTILAMPLVMPFYFDYDLLLLVIPAILIGRERPVCEDRSRVTRALVVVGALLFAWTMFNPAVSEATGVSLTVPLLAIVVALQAKRCLSDPPETPALTLPKPIEQRLAA